MNTKSFRHTCKKSYKELLFQLTKNFRIIFKLLYQTIYRPKPQSIDEIIDIFSKQTPNLTVVQVGANDGFNNDPICKFII
jgi:hypothetical protein